MNVRDNRTVPMVSATASKNKNGVIHISLSNVDADNAQEITVNLPDVNAKKAIGEILTSANLTDYNSFEKPNIVKPASFKEVRRLTVISCALSASTLEREIWITPFLFLEAVALTI